MQQSPKEPRNPDRLDVKRTRDSSLHMLRKLHPEGQQECTLLIAHNGRRNHYKFFAATRRRGEK